MPYLPSACEWCGRPLDDRRTDARFCGRPHKANARRATLAHASGLARRGVAVTIDAALDADRSLDALAVPLIFRAASAS